MSPPLPELPDDLSEISNAHLVGLRIALALAPQGPRERDLVARVDAEITRRAPAAPVAGDDQVVTQHELPLTHSLRLVPRPFSQLARRHWRLYAGTCFGYNAFLNGWPYYHQKRREPAVWCAGQARAHRRRCERARQRRAALTVTRLPPMMYGQGKVA